jgi:hypothetical protein
LIEDRTLTPGEARFGLISLPAAPRLENEAIAPLMSNAPDEYEIS